MQRLCGDCRCWKQDHALDHVERDSDTGVLESMHFGGICAKYGRVTWRDEWCRKGTRDPQIEQLEQAQEAIRQAALRRAAENGPKKRWRYERKEAPMPRSGLVLEQVMRRYRLRKNIAKAAMEIAGPFMITNKHQLWCEQDALDAVMRTYRDQPAAVLLEDARAAKEKCKVYYEAEKEAAGDGDQDPVQKP